MLQSGGNEGSYENERVISSRLSPSSQVRRLFAMLRDQCLGHDAGAMAIMRGLIAGNDIAAVDALMAACRDWGNRHSDIQMFFVYLYPFTLLGHPYTDTRSHYGGASNIAPLLSAVKQVSALIRETIEAQLPKGAETIGESVSSGDQDLKELIAPDLAQNQLGELVVNATFKYAVVHKDLQLLSSFIYTMHESKIKVTPGLLVYLFERRRYQVIYHLVQYQDLSLLPDPQQIVHRQEKIIEEDQEGAIMEQDEKQQEIEQLMEDEEAADNPIHQELKDPIKLNYPFSAFARALYALIFESLNRGTHHNHNGHNHGKGKGERASISVVDTEMTRTKHATSAYFDLDSDIQDAVLSLQSIYIFAIYIYETILVKHEQGSHDESIIRVWQHSGLERQAISLVLKLPELHSLEQYVSAILLEQYSMALVLGDRFNIFTEPLYKDFSLVILEKLLHRKQQTEVLLYLLKQNINYSLDFKSGEKLLNIFSDKLTQIVEPQSFLLNAPNSFKMCVLVIEVLLHVKRLFSDLTTRCNYQIEQIKLIAIHILHAQKDEDALRGQLFDKDLEGREVINIICQNGIIDLLNHESIEKFSRETWEGTHYLADTSIFRESTLFKIWHNDTNDSNSGALDVELLLRTKHLQKIKCCRRKQPPEPEIMTFKRGLTPESSVAPPDGSRHSPLVEPGNSNSFEHDQPEYKTLELQEHEAYRPLISLFSFTMWQHSTSIRYYQSHIAFFLIAVWMVTAIFVLIIQMNDLSNYGATDYLGYLSQLQKVEAWRGYIFNTIIVIFLPIPIIHFVKILAYNCCFARQVYDPVTGLRRKLYCEQLLKVYDEAFALDWGLFIMSVAGLFLEQQMKNVSDTVKQGTSDDTVAQTIASDYERQYFDNYISSFLSIFIVIVLLRVFFSCTISRRLGSFIKVLKLSCRAFLTWLVLFAISLSMFSMMAVMLFLQEDGHKCQKSYKSCVMLFFAASLGEIDYTTMGNLLTAEILLTVFVITNMIMLLNILIAMLSNTYNNIVKKGKLYYEKELFDTWNHYRLDIHAFPKVKNTRYSRAQNRYLHTTMHQSNEPHAPKQNQLSLFAVLACVDFPLNYITTALFLLVGWLHPFCRCRPNLITEALLYIPYFLFSLFSTALFIGLEILLLILAVPVAFMRKLSLVCSHQRQRWRKKRGDRCCELLTYTCLGFVFFSIFEIVMDTANFLSTQLCVKERKYLAQLEKRAPPPKEVALILRYVEPPRVRILKSNVTIVLELSEKLIRMAGKVTGFELNFPFEEILKELKELRKSKIAGMRKDKLGNMRGTLQAKQRLRQESDDFESKTQSQRQTELIKYADAQLRALLQVFVIATENSTEIVNMQIIHTVLKQRLLIKQVESRRAITKPFYAEDALRRKQQIPSAPTQQRNPNDSLFDSSITSQKPLMPEDSVVLGKSEIEMSDVNSYSPYISVPKGRKQARVWADGEDPMGENMDPVTRFLSELGDLMMNDFLGYKTQKILSSLRNYSTEKEGYSNLSRIEVNLKMAREYLALVYEEKYGASKKPMEPQPPRKAPPTHTASGLELEIEGESNAGETEKTDRSMESEPFSPRGVGFRDRFENVQNLKTFITKATMADPKLRAKPTLLSDLPLEPDESVTSGEQSMPPAPKVGASRAPSKVSKKSLSQEEDDDDDFGALSQASSGQKMVRNKRFQ